MEKKPKISYTLSTSTLKQAVIHEHLKYLYAIQAQMIEAAVEKSGYKEANEVIKYIMEKK